jgi:hypothetical protein
VVWAAQWLLPLPVVLPDLFAWCQVMLVLILLEGLVVFLLACLV